MPKIKISDKKHFKILPLKIIKINRKIICILIFGLFIRLLIMPLFAHGDIIAVHRRVEKIVCQGDNFLNYSAPGAHALEAFFIKIFSFFVPCLILSGLQENFYNPPYLNRMLFFFKLPYLLFELGFWWLVFKYFRNEKEEVKKRLAIFLAFNPVILYSVYLFGRFETYQIFFSMLILYFLKKMKLSIKTGVGISFIMFVILTIRPSYVYIIPALVLLLLPLKIWGVILGLVPIIAFGILTLIPKFLFSSSITEKEINWLREGAHPNYIFQAGIDLSQERIIYLFFLILGIIFLWWWEKRKIIENFPPAKRFSLFSSLIFLTYYGTSIFHPQYLSWILPFFIILMIEDKKGFLFSSFWWAIPFYFITFLGWGNHTTFGLLFPISTAFRQIEPGWYLPIFPAIKWANIGKSFFSAFCFYCIYYLMKYFSQNEENS